jgi:uncharacterized membrane protein YphA (DoxX/SURF4 family)
LLLSSTNAETPAAAAKRERAVNVTLWAVQVLLALFFAFAGLNKLGGIQQKVVDAFTEIGCGQWFRHLTGALELAGAIGLLFPRLSGLAALGLTGVMLGSVLAHLFFRPWRLHWSRPFWVSSSA